MSDAETPQSGPPEPEQARTTPASSELPLDELGINIERLGPVLFASSLRINGDLAGAADAVETGFLALGIHPRGSRIPPAALEARMLAATRAAAIAKRHGDDPLRAAQAFLVAPMVSRSMHDPAVAAIAGLAEPVRSIVSRAVLDGADPANIGESLQLSTAETNRLLTVGLHQIRDALTVAATGNGAGQ